MRATAVGRQGSAEWIARSLGALGGEATLGDLLVQTALPASDVETSFHQLMTTGGGHVRVYESGDLTYRLDPYAPLTAEPRGHLLLRSRGGKGALGFDHKTLRLIRARRGVLSLAELVEHTGFTLRDAEREMRYLAAAYGGEAIRSVDDHLVWAFPGLMHTVSGRTAVREPRPAWLRARAPLRRPGVGRSLTHFDLWSRAKTYLRARWSRRPFRRLAKRELRRFLLGHVYQVALAGKGVVSLDRAVEFVRIRAGGRRIRRTRIAAVLRGLAAEFDGPITVQSGGVFFGFRNLKQQFLASEHVRARFDAMRRVTGRIIFDSGDSPAEAERRELDLFDRDLGVEPDRRGQPSGPRSG